MGMIKLKNGAQEVEPLVRINTLLIYEIFNEDPICFFEFSALVKDHKHKVFGGESTLKPAINRGLVTVKDGKFQIHQSIRNITESMIVGEGFDMTLQRPEE